MEDIITEEQWSTFDEQVLLDCSHDYADFADFTDVACVEIESNHTQLCTWTDLFLDNGVEHCWSPSQIHSMEEELGKIIRSPHQCEESMIQPEHGVYRVRSCSGDQKAVNYDCSSGNTNFSFGCDGFMPSSTMDSEEYKGLRLVHLLTACAEAISNGTHDLAEIIFCKLTELVSPTGSSMERVAYYLSQSLRQAHLSEVDGAADDMCRHMFKDYNSTTEDPNYLGAFALLNLVYPYIRFAHFTANQSILEAVTLNGSPLEEGRILHIIDFDIIEGLQWPPLMEALKNGASKLGGLRLTAVKWDDDDGCENFLCKDTGRRLSEYASSLGIPFSFEETELDNLKWNLRQNDDDVIAVNCMWELPHMRKRSKQHLVEFFHGVRHLKPAIITVGSGPAGMDNHEKHNFCERFSECLRNLCVVFDSSQVGLPDEHGLARANVESLFLGPMVCRSMNYTPDNQDYDLVPVMDVALKAGFAERDISHTNISYAKYILASSAVGSWYTVELMGKHKLVLKWNSSSLACVSSFRAL
ncbi:protein NODULATION SIGNALING PATHWAY 2-like [Cryptomeria japonica]|uniref:protein NODULATION SIGNALING PATHWAY 2-like n=1 Tax=Cryptomeria japonica TaxID=3369 RepID=UPI0027DA923B|nr:protein NODULATION SIGNALING PATHWAY 2-like [Cryptomeria japonica]